MTTLKLSVEVSAADIRDVLGFETGAYPVRDMSDRIMRAILGAWQNDDEEHANRIIAAIPAGIAWCVLEIRKPGGMAHLRSLLERMEDDGDDD